MEHPYYTLTAAAVYGVLTVIPCCFVESTVWTVKFYDDGNPKKEKIYTFTYLSPCGFYGGMLFAHFLLFTGMGLFGAFSALVSEGKGIYSELPFVMALLGFVPYIVLLWAEWFLVKGFATVRDETHMKEMLDEIKSRERILKDFRHVMSGPDLKDAEYVRDNVEWKGNCPLFRPRVLSRCLIWTMAGNALVSLTAALIMFKDKI